MRNGVFQVPDEAATKTIVPDSSARTVSIRTFNGLAQVILQKK